MVFRVLSGFRKSSVKKVDAATNPGTYMALGTDPTKLVPATGGFWGILEDKVVDEDLFKERALSSVIFKNYKTKVGSAVDCWVGSGQTLTNNVVGYPAQANPPTGALSSSTPNGTQIEIFVGQPRILQTGGRKAGKVSRYCAIGDAEFGNVEEAWVIDTNEGA